MKVIEHIKQSKSTLFSFEILPPLKGRAIDSIFNIIDELLDFSPPFINVTYHREEYIYKDRGNGLLEKKSIRKRPGTVGICSAIMNKYQIDTVPHMTCGGFTKEETENALIDLNFLGMKNVLVVRGDPMKNERVFKPEENGHKYSIELLDQIVKMNNGIYLDEDIQNQIDTDFCMGVAGYPEKHEEAPNMKTDMFHLKRKIDAGADYIITQMFFNNQKYFDFVKECRDMGITVPIIPGLKTITKKSHLSMLPKTFHIDLPESLVDEMQKCKNDEQIRKVGIEWSIKQSKELMKFGVPCLHYYTMGGAKTTKAIAKEVF